MAKQVKFFWVNLVVGVLGLFIGSSYLLKDVSSSSDMVIGAICIILAVGWLVYVFISRNSKSRVGTKTS